MAKSQKLIARYTGVLGAAKGWVISRLLEQAPRILVITKDRTSAEDELQDVQFFTDRTAAALYPAWDVLPFEPLSPSRDVSAQRIATLWSWATRRSFLTFSTPDALAQKVLPVSSIEERSVVLTLPHLISREELTRLLERGGYRPVSLVEEVGDMAVRGAVVDFFPITTKNPVRVEFADDSIEKMKLFEPDSQRSISTIDSVLVLPVRELYDPEELQSRPALQRAIDFVKSRGKALETPPREIARLMSALRTGIEYPGMEMFQSVFLDNLVSPLEYLPEDTVVVIDDQLAVEHAADSFFGLCAERSQRFSAHHTLIPEFNRLLVSEEQFLSFTRQPNRILLDHLDVLGEEENTSENTHIRSRFNTELQTRLRAKIGTGEALAPLKDFLNRWRAADLEVLFVVGSRNRAERLHRMLLAVGVDAKVFSGTSAEWFRAPIRPPIVILEGRLSTGIELTDEGIVLIAENEIFHERSQKKGAQRKTNLKKLMSTLAQLRENDFVVHADYGVGIYRGLRHIDVEGKGSDFLHIDYADSRLYLPVQNIGKVQKFVGAEGQAPQLDKLSSTRWVKTKQKVKESVVSLAGDLIRLYAARSVSKGWRFEPWGAEDERFADGFPFHETPDQQKAIQDTIADMAGERPMDRLVCGDVGFGKTEVAVRAAFKAVQHRKQVVVLVPTTILVEQHKQTFLDRFAEYSVKIAALSRFYTTEQNKQTLSQLASGELDIVVGTHKLLSKDVRFFDVGVLIIDEEHRFGVKQKERIKQLRTQVDVLTLTATPIPRTLHMSLIGIRDISVISTPPVDRRVIRTYIAQYEETIVRDALLRELQRRGQAFFVHNRVQSIDLVTAELRELVPEARIEYAHGQMTETQLEGIMRRFLSHEIDVLVSTTIIESGLDIPNANTMIIDRADMYGLAQLYQLRGRVGRSTRQAYCYFMIPKSRKLGPEAQNRLKALQALDDLGLGFHLALRDMEIRGAGNLLGKEQSGNVLAVGFELYTKILKEAIAHLKGEELDGREVIDPEVKLKIDAFIPDYYIPDVSERLILYQRLAQIESSLEADELAAEIEDRFGPPSGEVHNLIELMRFRSLLRRFGVVKGDFMGDRLLLSLSPQAPFNTQKIFDLVKKHPNKYRFGKGLVLTLFFEDPEKIDPTQLYWPVEKLLETLQ